MHVQGHAAEVLRSTTDPVSQGLVGVVIAISLGGLRDIAQQSEHEHGVTDVLVNQLAQAFADDAGQVQVLGGLG